MAIVWQLSIIQFKQKTLVYGDILKNTSYNFEKPAGRLRNFRQVVMSYFQERYRNRGIVLKAGENRVETITDDYGGFEAEFENAEVSWVDVFPLDGDTSFEVIQNFPVYFPDSEYPLAVISDIDDTVLVSYTSRLLKRLRTLFFVSPKKRKSISFTLQLLQTIHKQEGRVFYVSKSESNLFGMLSSFMQGHEIPAGVLFLTPYLRLRQLLNPKKGKDYKEMVIRAIMDHAPEKRFVLLGDDTQQDMAVYTRIAELYPEKIVKIYIRKTVKTLISSKQEQWEKLESLKIPLLYFSDENEVDSEIAFIQNIYKSKP